MVALSFASDSEANIFYKSVTATIANRSKKRRSRKFSPTKTDGGHVTGYDSSVVLRNKNSTGKILVLSILVLCVQLVVWKFLLDKFKELDNCKYVLSLS